MKYLNKYHIISLALLVLVLFVQLVPFTNSSNVNSDIEDWGKTWAELPIGVAGKAKSAWPAEIKYGNFEDWEPSVKEKYPLYGEKNVSIFTYVWNPAGALAGHKVNAYILVQVLFIAFALFSFLVKNYLAKAIVAFLFGFAHLYAFIQSFVLKSADELVPFMPTVILLAVMAAACFAVGAYFIPEYLRDKAKNAEIKKSL